MERPVKSTWVGVAAARASWRMLPEPRIVTVVMSAWYVGCTLLGARLWGVPGWSGQIDWFSPLLLAVRHFLDDDNPVLWSVWELIS